MHWYCPDTGRQRAGRHQQSPARHDLLLRARLLPRIVLIPKSGDVLDGGNRTAILDGGNSAAYAIYGDSASSGESDVTIRGFVIQDFKTPLQHGAIEDFNGPGWIIEDNHMTKNAAAGVGTGDSVPVY